MIFAQHTNQTVIPLWVIGLTFACTLGVWLWAAARLLGGKRLLPRRSARLPRWKLADVIFAAIAYVCFLTATQAAVSGILDDSAAQQEQIVNPESLAAQHPVVILLEGAGPIMWLG